MVVIAILALAEQHISKTQLLTVIAAQSGVLTLVLFLARCRFVAAKKSFDSKISLLQKDIDSFRPTADSSPLTDNAETVLEFLMNKPEGTYSIHLAHEVRLKVAQVEIAIDQLKGRDFVKQTKACTGCGAEYGTTPKGRAYYAKK